MNMQTLAIDNDNVRSLPTCIDTSEYAWFRPLKNKTGYSIAEALNRHWMKKSLECKSSTIQSLCAEYKIQFYTSENDDIVSSKDWSYTND